MADPVVPASDVPAAEVPRKASRPNWTVQFLNDMTLTVAADTFRMDPSAQTIELQVDGEVVLTAPRSNVLYVRKVIDG